MVVDAQNCGYTILEKMPGELGTANRVSLLRTDIAAFRSKTFPTSQQSTGRIHLSDLTGKRGKFVQFEKKDLCLCQGYMYQICPILVVLYTFLFKLYMFWQRAD